MHSFEKLLLRCTWSPDGSQITCGSSDRMVYVWDARTCVMQYKLPGHSGSVNEVAWHPSEPIVGSASSDRTIFLGELMR
ncbi:U5 small nuclear ribonucleoprotein, partial [Haematococcus lacustris]